MNRLQENPWLTIARSPWPRVIVPRDKDHAARVLVHRVTGKVPPICAVLHWKRPWIESSASCAVIAVFAIAAVVALWETYGGLL